MQNTKETQKYKIQKEQKKRNTDKKRKKLTQNKKKEKATKENIKRSKRKEAVGGCFRVVRVFCAYWLQSGISLKSKLLLLFITP